MVPSIRTVFLALLFVGLSGCAGQEATPDSGSAVPSGAASFTDVTTEAGLGAFTHVTGARGDKWYPEPMGSGGGFLDYDGDGWDDILLVGGGTWEDDPALQPPALRLYRNHGDGTFTETTAAAGLADVRAYGIGIAAADYDNDGDDDFFFSTLYTNALFRNDGGTFTEVGAEAGVDNVSLWSSSALFFDADRDGWLDLYVANYVDWTPETDVFCPLDGVKAYCIPDAYQGVQSNFYRNNGDGTFTDRTREAGLTPTLGKSLGVTEMDYNRDGWPDFAVANDGEGDLLYENNGDGTFTERGSVSGFAFSEHGEARAGMGIDSGQIDGSDATWIFVGNFSEEMVGVYAHGGNGAFVDRAALSRIGYPTLLTLTFGLVLFDTELDGDLDVLIANGHVYPERLERQDKITYRQRPQLFLNRGDGVFDEAPHTEGPLSQAMVARGLAYADTDRDGDLDVLFTENGGPAHLWRNEVRQGGSEAGPGYLRVRLEGTRSNRQGIGAEVEAVVGGRRQVRRIRTGSSYLSQSEKVATFGLGAAERVDTLRVEWPSGLEQVWAGVKGMREIRLKEESQEIHEVGNPAAFGHQDAYQPPP